MAYEPNDVTGRQDAVIQEVDAQGHEVYTWNSAEHLDPDAETTSTPGTVDYAHINSIEEMLGRRHPRVVPQPQRGLPDRVVGPREPEPRRHRVAARRTPQRLHLPGRPGRRSLRPAQRQQAGQRSRARLRQRQRGPREQPGALRRPGRPAAAPRSTAGAREPRSTRWTPRRGPPPWCGAMPSRRPTSRTSPARLGGSPGGNTLVDWAADTHAIATEVDTGRPGGLGAEERRRLPAPTAPSRRWCPTPSGRR